MTQAGTPPSAAPPAEPVRAALETAEFQDGLRRHALARLGVLLGDRPVTIREEMAAEIVQEVSKRALERVGHYDAAQGSAAAWIHGITDRTVHERCRQSRKQPVPLPDDPPSSWGDVPRLLADDDQLLADLLNRLAGEPRRIVTMHHLDGRSHEEIAAELGISCAASRTRLSRAMAELKALAAKEGGR